jgi:hypothetical protein
VGFAVLFLVSGLLLSVSALACFLFPWVLLEMEGCDGGKGSKGLVTVSLILLLN